jgi:hypothetical protein
MKEEFNDKYQFYFSLQPILFSFENFSWKVIEKNRISVINDYVLITITVQSNRSVHFILTLFAIVPDTYFYQNFKCISWLSLHGKVSFYQGFHFLRFEPQI